MQTIKKKNNKKRGASVEKALVTILEKNGVKAKRVVASGAFKNFAKQYEGEEENFRGDIHITVGDRKIRTESKSRVSLPKFVKDNINCLINNEYAILNLEAFLWWLDGTDKKLKDVSVKRTTTLEKWFKQDEAEVVAMKEYGKKTWYFAVKKHLEQERK